MNARRRRLLVLLLMVLAIATVTSLLRPLRDATGFHVPGVMEARSAQAMFGAALDAAAQGEGPGEIARRAKRFGLAASRFPGDGPEGFALAEPVGGCAGRGAYLLRQADPRWPVAIVAPHRGADRWTGEIAGQLFEELPFAAAAWNSAPRRPTSICPAGGDVARAKTHYITAFSLAFARHYPGGRVIQLHGFDQLGRDSAAGRESDVIVSNGSTRPDERLLDLADCLSRQFPARQTSVYPLDTGELGAHRNRQGQALRAAGFAGFAHVELSAGFRAALVGDRSLRLRFAQCLSVGLE